MVSFCEIEYRENSNVNVTSKQIKSHSYRRGIQKRFFTYNVTFHKIWFLFE